MLGNWHNLIPAHLSVSAVVHFPFVPVGKEKQSMLRILSLFPLTLKEHSEYHTFCDVFSKCFKILLSSFHYLTQYFWSNYSGSLNNVILFNIVLLFFWWGNKSIPGQGLCLCGGCTFSPCLRGFSPGNLVSFHIPKMCTLGELACLHRPSPSERECGCGCERPLLRDASCPGWVLALHPELSCRDRLQPHKTLNWNNWVTNYLTCSH